MSPETYHRQCKWCGKDFESRSKYAYFHTARCKQAYWRWKHTLQLDVARVKVSLDAVHSYTDHEMTAHEAWTELQLLKEYVEWLLTVDEVGTRKMHLK